MTTITPASTIGPVIPTEHDARLALESSRQLSPFMERDLRIHITDDDGPDIELPSSAVHLLVHLLTQMAEGNAISLIPTHAELTTQAAADLLNVSRPFLVKLLDNGELAFRKVGTHRRVLFVDLMQYKEEVKAKRRKVLDELTKESQEFNL